jgi:hypothetical protein
LRGVDCTACSTKTFYLYTMTKQQMKQIREIANRLPVVYEQCASGGEVVEAEAGPMFMPNVYNHPVNHVRRMRKAYEQLGMDGIRSYLESIHQLQLKRNETLKEDIASGKFSPQGDSLPADSESIPEDRK